MTRRARGYLLLTVLALLSWWFANRMSPQQSPSVPKVEHSPEYFSTQFTKTVMNKDGTPEQRLAAQSMIRYQDDNTTELTRPVITFFEAESPPWVIRSDHGLVSSDRDEIVLAGHVLITREAAPGVNPIKVITSNLTIHRSSNIAETSDHADLISPPNRISGTGMRVHFQDPKTLSLLSNVRGKHEAH